MDTTGFTAKGLERKIAVQALFKKLLYLSEVCAPPPTYCEEVR